MRICRFVREGTEQAGFYFEEFVLPLRAASHLYEEHTHKAVRALATAAFPAAHVSTASDLAGRARALLIDLEPQKKD